MSSENAKDALSWILSDIAERQKEAESEKNKSDFASGRAEAYYEVMDMIRSRLNILDVALDEKSSKPCKGCR